MTRSFRQTWMSLAWSVPIARAYKAVSRPLTTLRFKPLFCITLYVLLASTALLGQTDSSDSKTAHVSVLDPSQATAPDATSPPPPENTDPDSSNSSTNHSDLWRYLSSYEFALAVLVLFFGVLVMLSAAKTLKGVAATYEQALRFYGVIVILVGTILLIVVGLNNNQIAPAVGLFGTLAGYLLGKNQPAEKSTTHIPPSSEDPKNETS